MSELKPCPCGEVPIVVYCQHCAKRLSHVEYVDTGFASNYEDYELWGYCSDCDAESFAAPRGG